MGLSAFAWRNRKGILLGVVVLSAVGFYFSRNLPVAIFPDLTAPRIIVTGSAGDTPIPTMLNNITRPLENAVAGVPGVTRVDSLTQRGSDELDVNFNWGTDMQTTLQLVNARLAQAQTTLPPNAQVTAERLNPSVFPVMGYSLYSKTVSLEELRRLALYTLRPRLLRVTGVQQISVLGGDTPDFLVQLDPTALLARGVTVQDVETALTKTNAINSVGYYDQSFLRYQILVSGLLKTAENIANITVAVKNRVPVTIAELGTVQPSIELHTIETSGDGHDAVLVNVIKQPTGNTAQVARDIRAALEGITPTLPPGITLSNFYDQSQIVVESEHSVLEAIIVGAALALIVLMLFLGNLRAAAVVLVILPLSIVITFGLMKALGQTMNIMTLGALAVALGLVIDDGIVVVENVFHELEGGRSRRAAIAAGLKAITPAMIGSSLTTMAAFLPLTFLRDLTGQFFGPLALVMIATLTVSLALSLLLTSILADWLLPKQTEKSAGTPDVAHNGQNSSPGEQGKDRHVTGKRQAAQDGHSDGAKPPSRVGRILGFFPRQFEKVVRVYGRLLGWCLDHQAIVIGLLVPVVAGSYLLFRHLQTGFFPEFDEGGFILDYQLPAGTSLAETSYVAAQIEAAIARTPEVAAWSRRTGAQLGFAITTQSSGDMSVRLKQQRSRGIQAVMDDIRGRVEPQLPAAQVDFHQILQDNIGDIAGNPSPVEIKVFGPDEATIESLARQVNGVIAKVPGIVGSFDGIVKSSPETVVDVTTDRAQRYGLTADDITHAVEAALQGAQPTTVQQGEQAIGVRVVLAHGSGALDASVLSRIPVASPVTGGDVPLSQLAAIRVRPGALQVRRENQREMIPVTASLSGRDLGSATRDIQSRVAKQVNLPPGYSIEYGGLYASQQSSFSHLGMVLVVAVLFVFTMLVLQFRSVRQAFALLVAAILSLFGVLLALFVTKTPLNISSFTGAVMVVGIITENGIVLFALFNSLQDENPDGDRGALIAQAGRERLRPILMTTIGAILALLPLALGLGAGAALQKPLAIAVIGGLCVSVFATLLVTPVLFQALERYRPSRPVAREEADYAAVEKELAQQS